VANHFHRDWSLDCSLHVLVIIGIANILQWFEKTPMWPLLIAMDGIHSCFAFEAYSRSRNGFSPFSTDVRRKKNKHSNALNVKQAAF